MHIRTAAYLLLITTAIAGSAVSSAWSQDPPAATGSSRPGVGTPWLDDVDHLDWGPLSIHTHAALTNTRLSYTPGRLGALPRGETEVMVAISHTNLWGDAPGYLLDMEMTRYSVRIHHGLGEGFEVDAELGALWRGRGVLDSFIEAFHNALGITQSRRTNFSRNQLSFITRGKAGDVVRLTNDDQRVGMANPVIGLRKELIHQSRGRPGLTVGLNIKLPFGDRNMDIGLASGGWDFMLHTALQIPIADPIQIFAVIGLVLSPGEELLMGVPTRHVQSVLLLGFEWRISPNLAFDFHFLRHDGVSKTDEFTPLDLAAHEFLVGFKWAPGRTDDLVFELAVIENSIHDANTPDFGIHLAARIRIR